MKFVHAADLHIDSPLRGLDTYAGAPVDRVRGATRRAFSNLIQLCLDERAAFLLLAGDVFDGDWRDFNTGLYFLAELGRLREVGTRVFIVRGNHDAASEVTRQLRWPDHVHLFPEARAGSVLLEEHGVALHGLGFAERAMTGSPLPLYPPPVAGLFNIGLLHTSLDGRPGHASYAPCRLEELIGHGYDYWALGHVHARELLHEAPWVLFPGNLQGRHIREAGAKGATLIERADGGLTLRHQPLDVVRWQALTLPLASDDDFDTLVDRARGAFAAAVKEADGRLVAARLTLTGVGRLHHELIGARERLGAELRARALEVDDLWLEKIELATQPPVDLDTLRADTGFVGELLGAIAAARRDPALAAELAAELGPLRDKLGEELGRSGIDLTLDPLLTEVEAELVAALVRPCD